MLSYDCNLLSNPLWLDVWMDQKSRDDCDNVVLSSLLVFEQTQLVVNRRARTSIFYKKTITITMNRNRYYYNKTDIE